MLSALERRFAKRRWKELDADPSLTHAEKLWAMVSGYPSEAAKQAADEAWERRGEELRERDREQQRRHEQAKPLIGAILARFDADHERGLSPEETNAWQRRLAALTSYAEGQHRRIERQRQDMRERHPGIDRLPDRRELSRWQCPGSLHRLPRPAQRRREPRSRNARRTASSSRDGPSRPDDPPLHPVELTPLQAALLPFVCSMEIAEELDERTLDAFLSIGAIRFARVASRLRWWEAA